MGFSWDLGLKMRRNQWFCAPCPFCFFFFFGERAWKEEFQEQACRVQDDLGLLLKSWSINLGSFKQHKWKEKPEISPYWDMSQHFYDAFNQNKRGPNKQHIMTKTSGEFRVTRYIIRPSPSIFFKCFGKPSQIYPRMLNMRGLEVVIITLYSWRIIQSGNRPVSHGCITLELSNLICSVSWVPCAPKLMRRIIDHGS